MLRQDANTFKKKLNDESSASSVELTYEYLLSLFVNHFNYSVDDFERLTPVEADRILYDKQILDDAKRQFLQSEIRNVCFFAFKTSMADTSRINRPSDLYKLPFEEEQERLEFESYVPPTIEAIQEMEKYL